MSFELAATVRDRVNSQLSQVTSSEAIDLSEKYKEVSGLIVSAAAANLFAVGHCTLKYADNGEELITFLQSLGYTVTRDPRNINIIISWSET